LGIETHKSTPVGPQVFEQISSEINLAAQAFSLLDNDAQLYFNNGMQRLENAIKIVHTIPVDYWQFSRSDFLRKHEDLFEQIESDVNDYIVGLSAQVKYDDSQKELFKEIVSKWEYMAEKLNKLFLLEFKTSFDNLISEEE